MRETVRIVPHMRWFRICLIGGYFCSQIRAVHVGQLMFGTVEAYFAWLDLQFWLH